MRRVFWPVAGAIALATLLTPGCADYAATAPTLASARSVEVVGRFAPTYRPQATLTRNTIAKIARLEVALAVEAAAGGWTERSALTYYRSDVRPDGSDAPLFDGEATVVRFGRLDVGKRYRAVLTAYDADGAPISNDADSTLTFDTGSATAGAKETQSVTLPLGLKNQAVEPSVLVTATVAPGDRAWRYYNFYLYRVIDPVAGTTQLVSMIGALDAMSDHVRFGRLNPGGAYIVRAEGCRGGFFYRLPPYDRFPPADVYFDMRLDVDPVADDQVKTDYAVTVTLPGYVPDYGGCVPSPEDGIFCGEDPY